MFRAASQKSHAAPAAPDDMDIDDPTLQRVAACQVVRPLPDGRHLRPRKAGKELVVAEVSPPLSVREKHDRVGACPRAEWEAVGRHQTMASTHD